VGGWVTECVRVNEWMSEWVGGWQCVSEWVNEWVSDQINLFWTREWIFGFYKTSRECLDYVSDYPLETKPSLWRWTCSTQFSSLTFAGYCDHLLQQKLFNFNGQLEDCVTKVKVSSRSYNPHSGAAEMAEVTNLGTKTPGNFSFRAFDCRGHFR